MHVAPGEGHQLLARLGRQQGRRRRYSRGRRSHLGRGHQVGQRSVHVHVVGPQLPDGVAPRLELGEERVALDDVGIGFAGRGRATQRQVPGPVDLVAEELDVLPAGGLVVERDLHRVGARRDGQRHVVVAAGVLGRGVVVGVFHPVPDRHRQPAGRLGDPEPLGRDAVVLVAAVGQGEVEGLGLAGQAAGGMHLVDQLVHVRLVWTQGRRLRHVA